MKNTVKWEPVRTTFTMVKPGDTVQVKPGTGAQDPSKIYAAPGKAPKSAYWAEVVEVKRNGRYVTLIVKTLTGTEPLESAAHGAITVARSVESDASDTEGQRIAQDMARAAEGLSPGEREVIEASIPATGYATAVARMIVREGGYSIKEASELVERYADMVNKGDRFGSNTDYVAWQIMTAESKRIKAPVIDQPRDTPATAPVCTATSECDECLSGKICIDRCATCNGTNSRPCKSHDVTPVPAKRKGADVHMRGHGATTCGLVPQTRRKTTSTLADVTCELCKTLEANQAVLHAELQARGVFGTPHPDCICDKIIDAGPRDAERTCPCGSIFPATPVLVTPAPMVPPLVTGHEAESHSRRGHECRICSQPVVDHETVNIKDGVAVAWWTGTTYSPDAVLNPERVALVDAEYAEDLRRAAIRDGVYRHIMGQTPVNPALYGSDQVAALAHTHAWLTGHWGCECTGYGPKGGKLVYLLTGIGVEVAPEPEFLPDTASKIIAGSHGIGTEIHPVIHLCESILVDESDAHRVVRVPGCESCADAALPSEVRAQRLAEYRRDVAELPDVETQVAEISTALADGTARWSREKGKGRKARKGKRKAQKHARKISRKGH